MAGKDLSIRERALAEYKRQHKNATGRDMPPDEQVDDYSLRLLMNWLSGPGNRPAPSLFC